MARAREHQERDVAPEFQAQHGWEAQVVEIERPSKKPKRTEEQKRQAFEKSANLRTSNAIDAMRKIAYLANTEYYSFSREQAQKMIEALGASVDALAEAFNAALEPSPEGKKKHKRQLSFNL